MIFREFGLFDAVPWYYGLVVQRFGYRATYLHAIVPLSFVMRLVIRAYHWVFIHSSQTALENTYNSGVLAGRCQIKSEFFALTGVSIMEAKQILRQRRRD